MSVGRCATEMQVIPASLSMFMHRISKSKSNADVLSSIMAYRGLWRRRQCHAIGVSRLSGNDKNTLTHRTHLWYSMRMNPMRCCSPTLSWSCHTTDASKPPSRVNK